MRAKHRGNVKCSLKSYTYSHLPNLRRETKVASLRECVGFHCRLITYPIIKQPSIWLFPLAA